MTQENTKVRLPYYKFQSEGNISYYEGRFWNSQGKQIAIVAVVTEGVDWAAYIGTDAPNSYRENDTCIWASKYGAKLSFDDAKHFFPKIKLPYRL